jgi:hypothetical protein
VPSPNPVQSVEGCANLCLNPPAGTVKECVGFEVYIDQPPATGNCYLFPALTPPFFELAPCATYLKSNATTEPSAAMAAAGMLDMASGELVPASALALPSAPSGYGALREQTMRVGPDLVAAPVFATVWQSLLVGARASI